MPSDTIHTPSLDLLYFLKEFLFASPETYFRILALFSRVKNLTVSDKLSEVSKSMMSRVELTIRPHLKYRLHFTGLNFV